MQVYVETLKQCIGAAKELQEQYRQYSRNPDNPAKSRDDVEWLVREYTKKTVEIRESDRTLQGHVKGFCLAMTDGSYQIGVAASLDEYTKRFVVCKELFHVVLDDGKSECENLDEHLDGMYVCIPKDDSQPTEAVEQELLAELGAMELLFPHAARIQELQAAAVDFEKLSHKYKLPLYLVERYLGTALMEALNPEKL
jgi:Zn-dependent peptidase ImmA (M78 family)